MQPVILIVWIVIQEERNKVCYKIKWSASWKTNTMSVRSAKTQISLGIRPVWSVFAVRMKKA